GACTNGDGTVTVVVKQSGTTVQTRTSGCSGSNYSVNASPALAAGTYTAQASQTDAAGNTGSSSTNTFTLDTTAPTASDIQSNPNPADGKAQGSDQVIYTFSEQMDPASIKSGWDGTSTSVTANFTHCSGNGSPDCLGIQSVNLGTVFLQGAYVQ